MSLGTAIVTGAGGLVGSHLLPLLGDATKVVAIGRAAPPAAGPNVAPLALDLSRPLDPGVLPDRADAVIYLAQSSRYRDFPEAADDIFQVNTARVADMLNYARRAGARHFILASTGGVYGTGDAPFSERAPPARGLGFYPATKLAAEILAEAYAPDMHVAILRFFFVYGAGQKRGMLVPRLVDNILEGRPIALHGKDGIRINPIHAVDAARATRAALRLEGSATVNVAGPEILSIRGMAETIGGLLDKTPLFELQSEHKPGHLIADISRMSTLLVPPLRRFEDGAADCF